MEMEPYGYSHVSHCFYFVFYRYVVPPTVITKYRPQDLVNRSPKPPSNLSSDLLLFSKIVRRNLPAAHITMAPKKDDGKARGPSTKVAVNKIRICPSLPLQPPIDRALLTSLLPPPTPKNLGIILSESHPPPQQKKGSAAQNQIKTIQSQAADAENPEQERKEVERAVSEAAKKETAEPFKPVQDRKVLFGVNSQTVLFQFYKQGSCEKGKKGKKGKQCKFSHDLDVGRKSEKRNLHTDTKEEEEKRKLRQAVMSM